MNRTVQTTQSRLHHFFTLAWSRKHLRQRDQNALRMRFLIFRRRQSYDHTKHTAHKEDFRKGFFVTLQRNSLSQPLHVCSKQLTQKCNWRKD